VTKAEALVTGDYGEGAYGPTILLVATETGGIEQIQGIFERLANRPAESVLRMGDESGVGFLPELRALNLRVVASTTRPRLRRRPSEGFEWSCTASEWRTLSALIEPLRTRSGHQYLTSEVEDDALVEVSRGEQLSRRL
jgi:hypothetical protein